MVIIVTNITKPANRRSAVAFPKYRHTLEQFGENIKLARKRRRYTQVLISERTGLSRLTNRKIEQGDPTVSIGHYVAVLGLVEDLNSVAQDNKLGRKLQDIELIGKYEKTE